MQVRVLVVIVLAIAALPAVPSVSFAAATGPVWPKPAEGSSHIFTNKTTFSYQLRAYPSGARFQCRFYAVNRRSLDPRYRWRTCPLKGTWTGLEMNWKNGYWSYFMETRTWTGRGWTEPRRVFWVVVDRKAPPAGLTYIRKGSNANQYDCLPITRGITFLPSDPVLLKYCLWEFGDGDLEGMARTRGWVLRAPLTGSSCGSYTFDQLLFDHRNGGMTGYLPPDHYEQPERGFCYRSRYYARDHAGNVRRYTLPPVKVMPEAEVDPA